MEAGKGDASAEIAAVYRRAYGKFLGSVFLAAGGRSGYLQRDTIQIGIQAADEAAVLVAARALTVVP